MKIAYLGDSFANLNLHNTFVEIHDLDEVSSYDILVSDKVLLKEKLPLDIPIVYWGDLNKIKKTSTYDYFFSKEISENDIIDMISNTKNLLIKQKNTDKTSTIDYKKIKNLEQKNKNIESENLKLRIETINTRGLSEYVLRLLSVNTVEQLIYETESLRVLREKGIRVTLIFSDKTNGYLSTKNTTKRIDIEKLNFIEKNSLDNRVEIASVLSRPVLSKFKLYKDYISSFNSDLHILFESQKDFLEETKFLNFLKKLLMENFIRVLQSEQNLKNSSLLSKAFSQIPNTALLVSSDYTIRVSNIKKSIGKKCFKYLFNRDVPCEGCPIFDYKNAVEKYSFYGKGFLLDEQNYAVYTTSVNSSGKNFYLNIYETLDQAQKRESIQIQRGKLKSIGLVSQALTHELNNPLTGMRELAEELSYQFTGQTNEDLLSISNAANRCLKIIESLNKFSSKKIEFERIKFSDVVDEAMILTKVLTHGVSLKTDLDNELWISGSRTLLIQAIFNIIKNAAEAMKQKGKISVKLFLENDWAVLKFEDSGPGFPSEMKDISLFGTKNKKMGTGFGLFLVNEFVKLHKGELSFYNKKEGGAVFCIKIPVKS